MLGRRRAESAVHLVQCKVLLEMSDDCHRLRDRGGPRCYQLERGKEQMGSRPGWESGKPAGRWEKQ